MGLRGGLPFRGQRMLNVPTSVPLLRETLRRWMMAEGMWLSRKQRKRLPPMLREAEDDSRSKTEAVLNIGCAVGELGTKPVCLDGADCEVAG